MFLCFDTGTLLATLIKFAIREGVPRDPGGCVSFDDILVLMNWTGYADWIMVAAEHNAVKGKSICVCKDGICLHQEAHRRLIFISCFIQKSAVQVGFFHCIERGAMI